MPLSKVRHLWRCGRLVGMSILINTPNFHVFYRHILVFFLGLARRVFLRGVHLRRIFMKWFKGAFLFLVAAFFYTGAQSVHAEVMCESSPPPVGWVVTSVNPFLNSPCAPHRQLNIRQILSTDVAIGGCTNTVLPEDWVFERIGGFVNGECAPYQKAGLVRAIYPQVIMCDATKIPAGYVVNEVTSNTGGQCSQYRMYVLSRLVGNTARFCDVPGGLPNGWVVRMYEPVIIQQCAPYRVGIIDKVT
jgi:hypothetical protein